jgi:hypothetical protein
MNNEAHDNTGLLATIMAVAMVLGIVGYLFAAFYFKIPGFESAPFMMVSWIIGLAIVTVLARRR